VKNGYEMGFGKALGMVSCYNDACYYLTGCSVTSTATAARRGGAAVSFTGEVSPTVYTANPVPATGIDAGSLATEISNVAAEDNSITIANLPQAEPSS